MKKMLFFVLFFAGCGYGGAPLEVTKSVTPTAGKLLMGSQPLGNVCVIFHANSPPGNDAFAVTESDGSFRLGTFGKDDGAIPGKYTVTVEPLPNKKDGRIPRRYGDILTSAVKVEIKKGEDQVIRLK